MLRTLSIAAFALASSVVAANAGSYTVAQEFALSNLTVDQGRATITPSGLAYVQPDRQTIDARLTSTDYNVADQNSVGTFFESAASTFTFSEHGNTVVLSDIKTVSGTTNSIFANVLVNGVALSYTVKNKDGSTSTITPGANFAVFSFAPGSSLGGNSFGTITSNTNIFVFTRDGAAAFNQGLGLNNGNTVSTGKDAGTFTIAPVAEPAAFGVLGLGLTLVGVARRRRAA